MKAQFRPEQVTAVVDTREQSPLDLSPLRATGKTLVAGDYSILGVGDREFSMELETASADVIAQTFEQFSGDGASSPDVGSCGQPPQP